MKTNTTKRERSSFLGWLISVPLRYVFGLPLTGQRLTNATFTHDGTGWLSESDRRSFSAYFTGGEPLRWDLLAGWKRGAIRVLVPAALIGVWWAWTTHPVITGTSAVLTAGVGLGALVASWIIRWQRREHMARYVRPLALVLGPMLGFDPEKPNAWLTIPRHFKREGAVIKVALPDDFVDDVQADEEGDAKGRTEIDTAVYTKLALPASEMRSRYELVGSSPSVEYRWRPQVPQNVSLEDLAAAIEEVAGPEFVLGLGRGRKVVLVDLDAESPHIALSVGTGGGKSVLIGLLAIQVLARGGRVVILDPKRGSHRWANGHPNVLYCRSMEEMHEGLMLVDGEMDHRQRATDDDEHAIDDYPRILIIVEERNALMERMAPWWDLHRERVKAETAEELPKKCPSLATLREVAYMGREPRLHVLSAAQRADATTMGGANARENYVGRIMGKGTTPQTWNFLAPGVTPRETNRAGRFFMAMGSSVTEFQGPKLSRSDMRELAWSVFADKEAANQAAEAAAAAAREAGADEEAIEAAAKKARAESMKETIPAGEAAAKARPRALFFRPEGQAIGEVVTPVEAAETAGQELAEPIALPSAGPVVSHVAEGVTLASDLGKQGETVAVSQGASQAVSLQTASESKAETGSKSKGDLTLIESPISLREAADKRIVSCSLAVLRRASAGRDPEFPAAVTKKGAANLYAPADLRRWERNRPKAAREESA
ncbi:hypothetical protein [Pseudoxanthomonas sp. UTMC 1351]|uniref:hypothetical protein n=1 Tax=Pseudoxanthomonas sp. UTMC 1351 TaxID=2695853 RepID=UPI0034CE3B77